MKIAQKIALLIVIIYSLFLIGQFMSGNHSVLSPAPGIAHAQNLHADLTYPGNDQTKWVFDIWKISLGLANVVVVLILIAIAAVNILHINYDTYAIKKSLPLLILGIIMSYFSLFISRMIVDVASVLTNTFAYEGNTKLLADNYLCSIALSTNSHTFGNSLIQSMSLILIIVFGILITVGILIISLLLLVRKFVIFILVAIAPAAFIMYAFPPTQGLFKQWWTQFVRWVFMGPAIMFIMWVASMIGRNNCTTFSVSALLAVVGLTYLCAIVPFRLGGGIMGAWGKAAGWATGTGKEGFLRKPVDKWWGDTKQLNKDRANTFMNKRTALGRWRGAREMELETVANERKASIQRRRAEVRHRKGAGQQLREMEIAESAQLEDAEKAEQALAIKAGKFNHISKLRLRLITGKGNSADVAQKYVETANRVRNAQDAIAKRDALDVEALSAQELRKSSQVVEDAKNFGAMEGDKYDLAGNKLAAGATTKFTHAQAVKAAADLRAKAATATVADKDRLEKAAEHFEASADDFKNMESTEYGQNGEKLKAGQKTHFSYGRAIEISTELRYKAKTATGAEREQLLEAAAHFDKEAANFKAKNKTVTAVDPTTGKAVTRQVKYDDFLSRNERGRRRAIVNRAVADDVQTEGLGNTARDLIKQMQSESFGSSETQSSYKALKRGINGNWHEMSPVEARAGQTFLRATVDKLAKAESGDLVAVQGLDEFCGMVSDSGRPDFKAEKIDKTMELMPSERQGFIKGEMLRQQKAKDGTLRNDWGRLTPTQKAEEYNRMSEEYDTLNARTDPASQAQVKKLKQDVDFAQMPVTGTSPHEKANKTFMGGFVEQISVDQKMRISKSPHQAVGRVTPS